MEKKPLSEIVNSVENNEKELYNELSESNKDILDVKEELEYISRGDYKASKHKNGRKSQSLNKKKFKNKSNMIKKSRKRNR